MTHQFTDSISIDGTRIRDDGYLVVDARVARIGIQRYLGSEVGKPELPFVDVYRPPEEVFSTDSLASFAHRPVTNDHPPEAVTADNWKKYAVGASVDEIRRDGDFVRVPLMVADANAIADVQAGKRELSNGYRCELKFEPGITPDGQTYDAVQTNIRGNHIAIVQNGRAGSECRIGDGLANQWGSSPVTIEQKDSDNMSNDLKIAMVDGLPIQTTDAGATAIAKLLGDVASLKQEIVDLKATHDAKDKEKDEELAKKDAALAAANAKVLDQAAIDKLVADRSALETQARAIFPEIATAGLSDAEIRAAVVVHKLGDDALKVDDSKSADYKAAFVDAQYDRVLADHASESKGSDQLRDALTGVVPNVANDAVVARQAAFNALVDYDATGQDVKVN